ncbi:beta-lactamase hydrolase domain-containing protein [Psychrobacter aestuarii]|uniref:Serine/threonine protein phosphatase n=1 Tax=Psychrobacter aestuarii TaxID=556327 RepID=A0ABN0VY46_9GAMM|nr:sulfur transferase domain-containing protein [Psychrobacter aestuarii]
MSEDTATTDSGVVLSEVLSPYYRPADNTIVCGALDKDKVQALADAGVELVINLQPEDELTFDEAAAVQEAGMIYAALPIRGEDDLKQVVMLEFDKLLRQYHDKKMVLHCKSGNRVGAAIALRAGWLRGRKIETALERGQQHGLTGLQEVVHQRLLVPR